MAQTNINLISTIKAGESPIKATKLTGVPLKTSEAENIFSEKLKKIAFERIDLSDDRYDPGRKGLNPVRPKLEKQGGVDRAPVSSDSTVSEKAVDNASQHVIQTTDVNAEGNNASGNVSLQQNKQNSGNTQNAEMQNDVENAPAEGNKVIADVHNQSLLLQLQGVFVPQIGINAEGIGNETSDEGDEVIPDNAVDNDYADKQNTGLLSQINKDADINAGAFLEDLKASANDNKILSLHKNDTEDGNKVNTSESDESRDKLSVQRGKSRKPYQGKLYKGTLDDLLKQGEISFRNLITFTVANNAIFIGSEGDSTGDAANLADGDIFQNLYDVLSKMLENQDEPAVGDQLRQLLALAIQKAVSDMHDPVKKEEEYQLKLMEFLMKFIEKINGRDDDKKTALENDEDENKEGLLLQIIDNLVKASKENSEEDKKEYTAAIYVYGAEVGLWTTDNSNEDSQTMDDESAKVQMVGYVDKAGNNESYGDISEEQVLEVKNTEVQSTDKNHGAIHTTTETEADFNANADATLNQKLQNGAVVNALGTDKAAILIEDGAKVQKTENVTAETIFGVSAENVNYNVQSTYQASNNGGNTNHNAAENSKNSITSINRNFNHKVIGASDEMYELQRLFGVKNRDNEKLKEMNELKAEADEASEGGENTEKVAVVKEEQGLLSSNSEESKAGFDKSIIESVTIEALKADNAAVAKSYMPDERGAKQIMTQIISEMLNSLSQNSGTGKTVTTLTMTLNPESLGKITMKVSEEAGKISLLVTAHNKETAEILSQRMDAMQQAAKDNGTQLEKYQVVYGPQEDGKAGQQNYDGSSKNPYVRQDNEDEQNSGGGQFADLLKQAI